MMLLEFKTWFNKTPEDLYGFGENNKKSSKEDEVYDQNPIQHLDSNLLLDNLQRLGPLNNKKAYRSKSSVLEFGDSYGKFIISVSPLGSFKILLRRDIKDLKGHPAPILIKCYPLVNDYKHLTGVNDEEKIAQYIYDQLLKLDEKNIKYCKEGYSNEDFLKLVIKTSQLLRNKHPKIMFFTEVVKINNHNYTICYEYKGGGNGLPSFRRALQFQIHLQNVPNLGLIRTWGNEVSTSMKTTEWKVQPSEWDEVFANTQKIEDISENIERIFSTY